MVPQGERGMPMKQLGLFGGDRPIDPPQSDPSPDPRQLSLFVGQDTVQFGVTTARPRMENRSYTMPGGLWPSQEIGPAESPPEQGAMFDGTTSQD